MPRRPPRSTLRRLAPWLALAAALGPGAACASGEGLEGGSGGIVGIGGGGTGGQSGGAQNAALVGRWWRLETFHSGGAARTSETFWEFLPDGTARRTVIASNVTDGIADWIVYDARWHTERDEVVVTYRSPVTGTVRFFFRIERDIDGFLLFLNEVAFRRLP